MDFDHRDPGTKSFNVMAGRAMLMSTRKVLEEVAKCDVVCVNCHRLRSREQHRAPCGDCGGRFPPCSMDFDHREPEEKLSRVPALIGRVGDARLLAEVAKCDIVCANCHRARTFERRGGLIWRE
jgi:hypothetical protein